MYIHVCMLSMYADRHIHTHTCICISMCVCYPCMQIDIFIQTYASHQKEKNLTCTRSMHNKNMDIHIDASIHIHKEIFSHRPFELIVPASSHAECSMLHVYSCKCAACVHMCVCACIREHTRMCVFINALRHKNI
jgi:hypothetical protein